MRFEAYLYIRCLRLGFSNNLVVNCMQGSLVGMFWGSQSVALPVWAYGRADDPIQFIFYVNYLFACLRFLVDDKEIMIL